MNTATTFASETSAIPHVPIADIAPDPANPRRHFDQTSLDEMANSIKAEGVIQPLVVRTVAEGKGYTIIDGERRYRAAQSAGVEFLPVVVREEPEGQRARIIQIVSNLQREDLSLPDLAAAVADLVKLLGNKGAAERLGKTEVWVSRHAALVQLPDPVKQLVGSGAVKSPDIAHDLGKLHELDKQAAQRRLSEFEEAAKRNAWSAAPTRERVRDALKSAEARHGDKQKEKEKKAELREKAKDDPKLAARLKAQRAQERAAKEERAAIKERAEKFDEQAEEQGDQFTALLCERVGLGKPKKNDWGYEYGAPLIVQLALRHINYAGAKEPPKSLEAAKYTVRVNGKSDTVTKAARLINQNAKIHCDISGTLTMVEMAKIAEVLGNRADFSFNKECTGRKLQALLAQPTADPKPPTDATGTDDPFGVRGFIKAHVRKATPAHRIASADFHAAYDQWCDQQGRDEAERLSNKDPRWGKQLLDAGIKRIRSNGIKCVGIKLVEVSA